MKAKERRARRKEGHSTSGNQTNLFKIIQIYFQTRQSIYNPINPLNQLNHPEGVCFKNERMKK